MTSTDDYNFWKWKLFLYWHVQIIVFVVDWVNGWMISNIISFLLKDVGKTLLFVEICNGLP